MDTEDRSSPGDDENKLRTEGEDLLEGNLIQKGDFDADDRPDGIHHG